MCQSGATCIPLDLFQSASTMKIAHLALNNNHSLNIVISEKKLSFIRSETKIAPGIHVFAIHVPKQNEKSMKNTSQTSFVLI